MVQRAFARALARFRRDLEMTLNEGDLIPSGRIQLCLVRSLAPEQFSIDLQSSESMIIRAADDLGAIYALLHLSRTALGVTPFWFWNDQQFERKGTGRRHRRTHRPARRLP